MESKKTSNFFWRNPKESASIKIVNPLDFSEPEILKQIRRDNLVPNLFGLTDLKEITLRNQLTKFILYNQGIQEKINHWRQKAETFNSLPLKENDFLALYEQNVIPYWEMIKEIIRELSQSNVPMRLQEFAKNLQSSLDLELAETNMAARIAERLKNVTVMEGVVDIRLFGADRNGDHKFILGKKFYSASWSSYKIDAPKWTRNLFCRVTGIKLLVKRITIQRTTKRANRSAAILDFPITLHNDLKDSLRQLLMSQPDKPLNPTKNKRKKNPREELLRNLEYYNSNLIFTVLFSYNDEGLSARVINMRNEVERKESFNFDFDDFDGYTLGERVVAKKIKREIEQKMLISREMMGTLEIYDKLQKYFDLFSKKFFLSSPLTDKELKWYALSNLYRDKENGETYKALTEQRLFTSRTLNELNNLKLAIKLFESEAKKFDVPICAPEIRNDGKVGVSFAMMAPINMMGQNKKMIPITMPIINGRIVCLTGRHGGGKSVAGNSVIENIFLAQSGLPVFAKSFSVDVKTVLGSVTNDHGEGSTATVFVQKVKNLFSEIQKVPKEKSLIFIDEIGKGTQEDQGFALGLKILTALKGQQYSVIFNTQIMRLAEYAKNNLDAVCLKVNKDHSFSEGIGDGQMEQLIKESGLDKYFK